MGAGEHVFLKTWEWEDMREDKGLSKREHEVWVGLRPTLVACCIFGMSVKKTIGQAKACMGVALCLTDWNNYLIRCGVSLFVDKLAVGYHLALSEDTFGIFLWRHATIVLKAAVEVGHVVEAYHIAYLCNIE